MERYAGWSCALLLLSSVSLAGLNAVSVAGSHAVAVLPSIEGPAAAEEDRTRVAVDCFYAENRRLPQCEPAAIAETPGLTIEGPVPTEEDRRRLAVDCFYVENASRPPCV